MVEPKKTRMTTLKRTDPKSECVGETHADEVNGRHGTLDRNGNFYEADQK